MATPLEVPQPWHREVSPKAWRVFIAAYLGWALDAMDSMLYSLVIVAVMKEYGLDSAQAGLLAALTFFAAGAGLWLYGMLADRIEIERQRGAAGSGESFLNKFAELWKADSGLLRIRVHLRIWDDRCGALSDGHQGHSPGLYLRMWSIRERHGPLLRRVDRPQVWSGRRGFLVAPLALVIAAAGVAFFIRETKGQELVSQDRGRGIV